MILRTRFQLLHGECILQSIQMNLALSNWTGDESGIAIDKTGSLIFFRVELKENSEGKRKWIHFLNLIDEYIQSYETFNLNDVPCGIKRGSLSYIAKQNKIESFIIPTFSGKIYCVEAIQDKTISNLLVKLQDLMLVNNQIKSLGCKNQESKDIINGDILSLFLEMPTALQLEILQNQLNASQVTEILENTLK